MAEDELPVAAGEDVELDVVDAVLECCLDGLDRVRGRERRRASMPDPEERPIAAEESHGAVGSGYSSKRPPRAANSRIIRSVIHSTGARSSVHGSDDGAATRRSRARRLVSDRSRRRPVAQPAHEHGPRLGPVEPDHELVEAQRLPGEDQRELRRERAGDALGEPVVVGRRPTLRTIAPPGASRGRASRKNSCVAR